MWFFPQNGVCAGYHAVVGLWRLLGWGGSYLSRFCRGIRGGLAEGLSMVLPCLCPAGALLLPSRGLRLRRWCVLWRGTEHAALEHAAWDSGSGLWRLSLGLAVIRHCCEPAVL